MDARTHDGTDDSTHIGRAGEMSTLCELLAEANSGVARLALVSGQPGIGKTHLVRAFARKAEAAGALCLFGICDEDAAMPPYWPWVQIVRALISQGEDTELSRLLGDEPDLINALLPATELSTKKSTFATEQPAQMEFRLFSTISGHLTDYAQHNTLLLIIDNLHAADQQSLRLLEFLARHSDAARLLIVGTYRDVAISRKHPLSNTLGALGHSASITRLRLKGLARDAVGRVIEREAGHVLSDDAVDTICERTEGNPLFVTEIARGLADELSRPGQGSVLLQIPDGIREAIGRRLNYLPEDCNDLLGVASVIGRTLLLDELAALAPDKTPIEILETLQPAVAAGILEVDEKSARLQFSHVLIRDTLFEELPMARRLLLHREFAQALQRRHVDYPEPALGKIARHYYLAIQAGCVQEAVTYATQAAHHYRRVLAFEEAVTYYELAIDAQSLDKGDHRWQLAELYLCLARSKHYAGAHIETMRELLEKAMDIAKECGHHECFVEGACDYVYYTFDKPDERGLAVCNTALAMLAPENTAARARVLVQKSVALKIIDRRADAEKLVYEAIDLAQQCGRHDILCEVLSWGNFSLRGRPEMLSERIALGERCLQVATEHDDLAARVDAMKWLVLSCQEAGDTARVKKLAADFKYDSERFGTVPHRYVSAGVNAYCALLDGDWAHAEELVEEAYALGKGSGNEGSEGIFGTQMFLLNRELGRLPLFAVVLRQFVQDENQNPWRPGLACILIEIGLKDEALKVYGELVGEGLHNLPRDEMYLATLTLIASVTSAVGDAHAASSLYPLLLPYSGQMAVHPTAACLGPADLALSELARVLNRRDDALLHAEKALALAQQAQSPPWTAYAQHLLAALLVESPQRMNSAPLSRRKHRPAVQSGSGAEFMFNESSDAANRQRVDALAASARSIAERLGMVRLLGLLDQAGPAETAIMPAPDALSPRELEILELIAAGRSNKVIARTLFISLNTVATHVRSILQKTHATNRTEAAAYAFKHRIGEHATVPP